MHGRELCTVNQTVPTRSQEISYGMVEITVKSYEIRNKYEILYNYEVRHGQPQYLPVVKETPFKIIVLGL